MSQSERIFFILRFLDQKGGIATKDVVQAFEVSDRQAKRDIEYMRDRLGAPIVWRRETGRYEYAGPWGNSGFSSLFPNEFPYQAAFDAANVAIAVVSEEPRRIMMTNKAFERFLGKSTQEILGRDPVELGFKPEVVERARSALGKDPTRPFAVQYGEKLYVAVASPFESPQGPCTLYIMLDATDLLLVGEDCADAEVPDLGSKRKRILVVDDDELVLQMLGDLLSSLGYEPTLASSGRNAMGILGEGVRFDLAVLDIMMPGMDGLELFNRIQDSCPGQPCIFLSGYSHKPLDHYRSHPHVRGFLRKPIGRKDLGSALEKAMAGLHAD